jgi:hypothetical protein
MQFNKRSLPGAASRTAVALLCAWLTFGLAAVTEAQSGRRVPKRPTTTEPLPPKESEPPVEESKPKDDKPQIPILVVKDVPNMSTSTILANNVVQACLKRLSESLSVKPRSGKDMNRKQASDAAKATTDTYAVLIQLEIDYVYSRSRDNMGYVDPRALYIRYEVFSPATGKTKTSGNVYQRNRGPGGVPMPVPNTGIGAEYALIEAGRETADRVLAAIGVAPPPERRF